MPKFSSFQLQHRGDTASRTNTQVKTVNACREFTWRSEITFGSPASRFGLSASSSCFNMRWMGPIVEVRDLHVAYSSRESNLFHALNGVSFCLESGEVLGV